MMLLMLSMTAFADIPVVTWDPANLPLILHTSDPLTRDWSWSCDDPSDEWPLTQRCQVIDVTDGKIGTGLEQYLVDDDCGEFASEPTFANFTYDVPLPIAGYEYLYTARCKDSGLGLTSTVKQSVAFVYDPIPPVATIVSGPADGTATAVHFDSVCDDGSFTYDFESWNPGHQTPCYMACQLFDNDDNSVVRPL